MKSILAIDVGKHGGYAFKKGKIEKTGILDFVSLEQYYRDISALISVHKPYIVVSGYPTRFYNVIVFQSKLLAIVELAVETARKFTLFMEVNDCQAKKAVIGSAKAKKADIMKKLKVKCEHSADALMFARFVNIQFEKSGQNALVDS